ncbi:MAG: AzlC family ABC transporter permease [Acetivibrio ethanolgignens]
MKKYMHTLKKAFVATLPVMAAYLVLGAGFGIVLKTKGYGIIWAIAMSLLIYAGSMQFVAINLISGGASYLTIALTTLMVNARHLFYGISMIEKYKDMGKVKPYLIFSLTDETYSLVGTDKNEHTKEYYLMVSLLNQLYWISGSVIGSLLGSILPFNTEGIDFSLAALFITIFIDQWRNVTNHFPAALGVITTLICLLVFGADNFLIPAMLVITAVLLTVRGREEIFNEY